jgi:cytochrome c biogenesis protein ResB
MVNITEIEKYRILRNHNLLVTEQDKSKFEKKVDKAGEKVEKEKYGELIEFASDKVVDAMNLIKGFEKKVKGREPLPTLNPTRVYTDLKKLGVTEFFIYLFRDITQYASVVMFLKSFLTEDCDTVKSSVPEIGEVSMEELINIISSENKEVFKIIKKS